MLTIAESYDDVYRLMQWRVPKFYNMGVDVCDKHAKARPDAIGLIAEDENGAVTRYSFADLKRLSNRLANVLGGSGMFSSNLRAQDADGAQNLQLDPGARIRFTPIAPSSADDVVVPNNYHYATILRWGDPLFPGAPAFDLNNQTRAIQEQQFGFNCDFIGWYPLPFSAVPSSDELQWLHANYDRLSHSPSPRALLAVNHEYTSGYQMFPGYQVDPASPFVGLNPTQDQVETEIAAHGMSIIEIELVDGVWQFVIDSPLNRRITGYTVIDITGPLSGDRLLQTTGGYDDSGTQVWGMLNNCAGGKTP